MGRYVCVVAGGYPSAKYIRNGLFEWDQAKALANIGIKIVYAAVDLRSVRRKRHWGMEHFVKDGIDVYAVNVPVGAFPPDICEHIGTMAFRLLYKKILKEQGKPSIMHSHFLTPSVIASQICEEERIPFVLTEHSSSLDKDEIPANVRRRAKKAYSRASGRIAVSESLCAHLKKTMGYDFDIIYNMVDLEAFPYRAKKEPGKFTFAITGHLLPDKGHKLLLHVFKKIVSKYPDTQLWIFGDGKEHLQISKLIDSLKITESVEVFGNVERHIIGQRYSFIDAFVLPSKHETFGVAYIEAMAAGVPVIATKCGGPERFVNPQVGLLIDVDDEDALFMAMEHMILCKGQYDRKYISDYAKRMFAPQHIAKRIVSVYGGIIGQNDLVEREKDERN